VSAPRQRRRGAAATSILPHARCGRPGGNGDKTHSADRPARPRSAAGQLGLYGE